MSVEPVAIDGELDRFMAGIGLGKHTALMVRQDVDVDTLVGLTEQELMGVGLPIGAAKRVRKAALAKRGAGS
jgi:hypothetical protein